MGVITAVANRRNGLLGTSRVSRTVRWSLVSYPIFKIIYAIVECTKLAELFFRGGKFESVSRLVKAEEIGLH
jgi:hypothetical protein